MTTAGRPTFDTARGGTKRGERSLSAMTKQYSSRDLPGHTKLKYRQPQEYDAARDLKKELEERERSSTSSNRLPSSNGSSSRSEIPLKRIKTDSLPTPLAPDDEDEDLNHHNDSDEDSADDSDEDDTAELLAELNRIKKERAMEEAKAEAEKTAQEEKIRMENILTGNPLIAGTKTDFKVKRRWDDDVVFKNCARNEPDKSKPSFINDTLRSEFHKKFMDKYIK
jgi:protein CWC15